MSNRIIVAAAAAAILLVALAGCSTGTAVGTAATGSPAVSGTPSASAGSAAAGSAVLTVASSSLGDVVVDGKGMTVYVFDHDTAGSPSTCAGGCAALWPAVTTDAATPDVTGITGAVGTVATADGRRQVTLDGLPVYTYAQDAAAGDVRGQGVGGIWWAVGASGAKITAAAGADDHGQDGAGHDANDDNGGGTKGGY